MRWHDGRPFTADDVVFNWEYTADPATASVNLGTYKDIARVEKLGALSVKVVFKDPTPFWFDAYCGNRALIPKHLFASPFWIVRGESCLVAIGPVPNC